MLVFIGILEKMNKALLENGGINMFDEGIVDDLFSIVVRRYHEEKPDVILTNDMLDSIWFAVYGELNKNGKEKAYEYARTGILLYQ